MRKKIPKILRLNIWNFYEGKKNKVGNCLCCNSDISYENFHCGHIKSDKNGGELTIENLRPVCQNCNLSMGTTHMLDFMSENKLIKPENFDGYDEKIKKDDYRLKIFYALPIKELKHICDVNDIKLKSKMTKSKIIDLLSDINYKQYLVDELNCLDKNILEKICDDLDIEYTSKKKVINKIVNHETKINIVDYIEQPDDNMPIECIILCDFLMDVNYADKCTVERLDIINKIYNEISADEDKTFIIKENVGDYKKIMSIRLYNLLSDKILHATVHEIVQNKYPKLNYKFTYGNTIVCNNCGRITYTGDVTYDIMKYCACCGSCEIAKIPEDTSNDAILIQLYCFRHTKIIKKKCDHIYNNSYESSYFLTSNDENSECINSCCPFCGS